MVGLGYRRHLVLCKKHMQITNDELAHFEVIECICLCCGCEIAVTSNVFQSAQSNMTFSEPP